MSSNINSGGGKWKSRRKRSKSSGRKKSNNAAMTDHSQQRGRSIATPLATQSAKYETTNGSFAAATTTTTTMTASKNDSERKISSPKTQGSKNAVNVQESDALKGGKRNKRRCRRAPRRRWKPYYKLTNEERRLLEIREEKRAERIRAMRFKHGLPVAPYNTTQFLLNDRQQRGNNDEPSNVDEIVASIGRHHHDRPESNESGSDSVGPSRSSDEGSDYSMMEKEFDNEYESAYAERLESMTKNDLIKDFLELEKQYEKSQRELSAKNREIDELRQRLSAFEDQAKERGRLITVDIAGDEGRNKDEKTT